MPWVLGFGAASVNLVRRRGPFRAGAAAQGAVYVSCCRIDARTTSLPLHQDRDRHPPGLYALFTTEMWERFSYYGMRALLVLYLTKAIGLNRPDALNIYAIYTGLIYLTPLIGGRLADRYLGQRKAVFIGGILMALGQFALTQRELLNLGLGLLIVGNGFFKPNISTMVGALYPQGDARRDGAYTIFYMGINLGAFLSPLICGPLGERIGWGYGFAAAGSRHDPGTADIHLHAAIAPRHRAAARSARPRRGPARRARLG